jgi:hypothetical protein
VERELALGVIQGAKKRDTLNVVPMKVGDENVSRYGAVAEFAFQLMAQDTKAGAAIEDVYLVAEAQLDAGGISSVAHVFGLWRGSRSPHTPKSNPHSLKIA